MYSGKGYRSNYAWSGASSRPNYRSRRGHARRNTRRRNLILAGVILILILLAVPFVSPLFITVDRVNLVSEQLPSDIGRMRIVYVTDIHWGYFFDDGRLYSLVNQINDLKPDLVLFGGDYATDNASAIQFFKKLPSIHRRYAMLGVIGDTDRGENPADLTLLTDTMRNAEVTPLVNNVVLVRLGNSSIYVAGADDYKTGKPDLTSMAAQVSSEDYVILLAHNPSVIPDAQGAADRSGRLGWFDLGLFGHTHGGQIAGLSGLLDIAGEVEGRYQQGWIQENRVDMLISNGVGTSVIPARLFCPAQIHCIDVSRP